MATLARSLDELIIKKPTSFKGLTVFPVVLVSQDFARSAEEFNVLGTGRVNQHINPLETGTLNRIKVTNRAKTRAIIMDGTTVQGGAANRMFLSSAILGHNEVVELPVCSVEQGRWEIMTSTSGKSYITTKDVTFRRSEFSPAAIRRLKFSKSTASLEKKPEMAVDQDSVWKEVKSQLAQAQVKSGTADVHSLYSHWIYILFMFTARFRPIPGQIGLLSFMDKFTWYADFFINESTLQKAYDGLIKSYAVEALARAARESSAKEAEQEHAEDVLAALRLAKLKEYSFPGSTVKGTYFINSKRAVGTALMDGDLALYSTACSK